MRKFLLSVMIIVPTMMMAQSEWQLPNQRQQEEVSKNKKEKKDKKDNASAKEKKNGREMKIDEKYARGAVPEVDGKVEWQKTIHCPGQSADQIYSRVEKILEQMTHGEGQLNSQISAVNPKDHIIAAKYVEEMVFKNAMLSKDFAEARYTIIASCKDGSVDIKFCRISYKYNIGRSTQTTYMAEEWITDKESLNKYGTNTYPGNGKFRKKTIDRKDEIFEAIEKKLK